MMQWTNMQVILSTGILDIPNTSNSDFLVVAHDLPEYFNIRPARDFFVRLLD